MLGGRHDHAGGGNLLVRRMHTQAGGIIDAAMSSELVPIHGIDAGLVMAEVAWHPLWSVGSITDPSVGMPER